MTLLSDQPIGTDDDIPRAALVLGWAGVVPFAAGALALWFTAAAGGWVVVPLLAYGAAILAFLGGVRWALAFRVRPEDAQARELAISAIPSLVAWLAVAMHHRPLIALALLAIAHGTQGYADVTGIQGIGAPAWYARLRLHLSIAAVVALIVALGALIWAR
jgi:hypothetical protein